MFETTNKSINQINQIHELSFFTKETVMLNESSFVNTTWQDLCSQDWHLRATPRPRARGLHQDPVHVVYTKTTCTKTENM